MKQTVQTHETDGSSIHPSILDEDDSNEPVQAGDIPTNRVVETDPEEDQSDHPLD